MSNLFRREVAANRNRRLGDVVLRSSFPYKVLSAMVVTVVLLLVILASTASYVRRETVTGWLTPSQGLVRLTAASGGIVEELLVREGDAVQAGQPVARLRTSQTLSEGDSFTSLARTLEIQRRAALSKAQSTVQGLRLEAQRLGEVETNLEQDLREAQHRVALQRRQVSLAQAEVERAETVAARGFLSGRELERRRSAVIQTQQSLSEMTAAVLSLQRQLDEVRSRRRAIPLEEKSAAADRDAATASLDQEATQSEAASVYMIVSTRAGRVGALPVIEGEALTAGNTLAIIMPEEGSLEAEVYVPSRAAGFVREGQIVRLMYDAFPYQKFGAAEARLVTVSDTVLMPNEISAKGLAIDEPVFRARARLVRQSVSAYGRQVPLQPGMTVTADIQTDRRNLIEWLFDPIYAVGKR